MNGLTVPPPQEDLVTRDALSHLAESPHNIHRVPQTPPRRCRAASARDLAWGSCEWSATVPPPYRTWQPWFIARILQTVRLWWRQMEYGVGCRQLLLYWDRVPTGQSSTPLVSLFRTWFGADDSIFQWRLESPVPPPLQDLATRIARRGA